MNKTSFQVKDGMDRIYTLIGVILITGTFECYDSDTGQIFYFKEYEVEYV